MEIIRSQYKDPYEPTSTVESRRVFWAVAHMDNMEGQNDGPWKSGNGTLKKWQFLVSTC